MLICTFHHYKISYLWEKKSTTYKFHLNFREHKMSRKELLILFYLMLLSAELTHSFYNRKSELMAWDIGIQIMFIFKICICKSLRVRRFTLGDWCFLSRFFVLYLSLSPSLSLFLSLSFSLSLLILIMDNKKPEYNIPKLSLSLSKSSRLIALNANLWTFSSLFLIMYKIRAIFKITLLQN